MIPAASAVLARLAARGETLATAESLTGGLLAATLVDVPGASQVFRGGLVVYATELKSALAGVSAELLARVGAVDREVVMAMADGARLRCQADWGVATTGVAGPEPQDGHQVGTVWIAVAGRDAISARYLTEQGDRTTIRHATVRAALRFVLDVVPGGATSEVRA